MEGVGHAGRDADGVAAGHGKFALAQAHHPLSGGDVVNLLAVMMISET